MTSPSAVLAEPHLSVSQITSYLACPRRYRFERIDKLPWPTVPSTLVFGTAVHAALAALAQARLEGEEVTLEDLQRTFRVAWAAEPKPIELKDGETAEALDAMARALLVIALERSPVGRVLAVEEPFRLELGPGLPPIVGVIDLVEERDGKGVIVEHKTAAQRFTEQRVNDDLQPTVYALAGLQMGLPGIARLEDIEVRYEVYLKHKTPSVDVRPTRRSQAQAEELRDTARAVWTAREVGVFPRIRSWACATCPFQEPCRK